MSELLKAAEQVHDRESFITFVSTLSADYKLNRASWEHQDLVTFLEALASWIEDMDGYYENMGTESPKNVDWGIFKDALMAARIYE